MIKRPGTLKTLFAGLVAAQTLILPSIQADPSGTDAFSAKAGLKLIDSVSSIPLEDITPANYKLIAGSLIVVNGLPVVEGGLHAGCYEQFFVDDFLISGYTNLAVPGAPAGFFSSAIIHDTSANTLNEVGRLQLPAGLGISQTAISPVINRPFICASTFTKFGFPAGPYVLNMYAYDSTTGAINNTPISTLNLNALPPKDGQFTNWVIPSFTGVDNFSHDGKYLFYTRAVGPANQSAITGQTFGILAINSDGTIQTPPVVEIMLPDLAQGQFFSMPDVKTFIDPSNSSVYKLVVAIAGYNFIGPFTPQSLIQSYDFNPEAGTLVLTGNAELPCTAEGYDVNPDFNRIVVLTNSVSSDGISVEQSPTMSYPTGAPDPGKEFRLYSLDINATGDAISYIAGHNIGWGWNARWSHNGKYLAYTTNPGPGLKGVNPAVIAGVEEFSPARSPSVLVTLEFNEEKDTFKIQDVQPASFFSSDIAWSKNDKLLSTAGEPSPVQKDIQLYKVDKWNIEEDN